ncbi:MAG: bifunctional phosphoglucose/phosphomannose isomerase [Candidatus Zixiibacteriota bacterium]
MKRLDDLKVMHQLDPSDMYGCIYDFPEHLERAQEIGESWNLTEISGGQFQNVTLVGMGGSAIGGDLARNLLAGSMKVPFAVCRNYRLPAYVGEKSFVIAASYSGNTEETLAATADALERGATVAALTTGGRLGEIAETRKTPHVILPAGLQPRAALAYSLAPLLHLLERIGFVEGVTGALDSAIKHLRKQRACLAEESPAPGNTAKALAVTLEKKLPLVYAGPDLTESAAVRWRGQLSENGKALAFSSTFPEMNHNELVGWSKSVRVFADRLTVVLLRDEDDHERVKLRLDYFAELLNSDVGVSVNQVQSSGPNRLARLLSLVQLGDFVSYYVSALNRVDPTPVEPIEKLKRHLARV